MGELEFTSKEDKHLLDAIDLYMFSQRTAPNINIDALRNTELALVIKDEMSIDNILLDELSMLKSKLMMKIKIQQSQH